MFPKGGQEKLRSGFGQDIRRGQYVAVKVGVDELGSVNDQIDQSRSVCRDDILVLSGRPGVDGQRRWLKMMSYDWQ